MNGRILCVILTCLALLGCIGAQSSQAVLSSKAYNFANADRLQEHYQKHVLDQKEWGTVISKVQYLANARAFFNAEPKLKQLIERNGDSIQYKKDTNEFGVLSSKDIIRTYFRPSDGQRYFDRQRNR